ncbi:MAG: hypothetical protein QUU85_17230, partial [Candidatus Eisenbacteria bacterium]|nr:hypothetical protein [Candidatus Eisenbacteria bacterium]
RNTALSRGLGDVYKRQAPHPAIPGRVVEARVLEFRTALRAATEGRPDDRLSMEPRRSRAPPSRAEPSEGSGV